MGREPLHRRTVAPLVGIAAGAFLVRIAWLSLVYDVRIIERTDQFGYANQGANWANLDFSSSVLRTPVYPSVLAIIERAQQTVGSDLPLRVPVGLLQSALAAAMVFVVGAVTVRLTGSRAAGLCAAIFLAVWPNQIIGASAVMTELVATPLLVFAGACALWHPPDERRNWQVLGAAVFAGLAVLTRPALLPTAFVLALLVSVRGSAGWRAKLRNLAVFGASFLVVLSPWLGVVSHKEGSPTLSLGSASGFNLCLGNNPLADGTWRTVAAVRHCPWPSPRPGEMRRANAQTDAAREWALANLDQQPRLIRARVASTFRNDGYWLNLYPGRNLYEGPWNEADLRTVAQWYWRRMVWLSLAGLVVAAVRDRRLAAWLLALASATVATTVVSIGEPRFHDALVPFMAGFAGVGLWAIVAALGGGLRTLSSARAQPGSRGSSSNIGRLGASVRPDLSDGTDAQEPLPPAVADHPRDRRAVPPRSRVR